eukprot:CAMPEP_0184311626 /NCGR_PEP_ID=MMETSP1049-20130417/43224_1 /TAXON_ID=77928 /ORGANISM="Proteomonas sulcata, Strain CCMP704" /LENGTH=67 /DNA_ID=CAMNT_0026627163 /DNA_START=571 /DNA_END=774 /DNA_ORIENTATION=-
MSTPPALVSKNQSKAAAPAPNHPTTSASESTEKTEEANQKSRDVRHSFSISVWLTGGGTSCPKLPVA